MFFYEKWALIDLVGGRSMGDLINFKSKGKALNLEGRDERLAKRTKEFKSRAEKLKKQRKDLLDGLKKH